MKSYWIIGMVEDVAKRGSGKTEINNIVPDPNDKRFFYGGIEKEINGQTYLIVPLSEICRVFDLELKDFLDDKIIDRLNKLKKKQGFYPILTTD